MVCRMPISYLQRRDDSLAAADRIFTRLPFRFTEDDLARLGGDPGSIGDDLVRRFARIGIGHWDPDQYQIAWQRLTGRILALLDSRDEGQEIGLLMRGWSEPCIRLGQWPAEERAAVLEVLGTTLDLWLTDGRPAEDVVTLLGALAHVYDDIAPWFARIDSSTGPVMDAGLVRLTAFWAIEVSWGEEPIFWWWYPPDPLALARAWLCSPAVQQRLTSFAARNPRCKNAADALAATRALAAGEDSPWLYPRSPGSTRFMWWC